MQMQLFRRITNRFKAALTLTLLLLTMLTVTATAQESRSTAGQTTLTSAFTYQGYLADGANAATGSYDFQFALFDAETGGNQVGATVERPGVAVANGLFSAALDFGAEAWAGAARFLEVRMRRAGAAAYNTLTPRHAIHATPYALYAAKTGAHQHLGESWNGLNNPLAITGAFNTAPLEISNDAGDGVRVLAAGDDGVEVSQAAYGVYVANATTHGFFVSNAGNSGVTVSAASEVGVRVGSAPIGLRVANASQTGVEVTSDWIGVSATGVGAGVVGYASSAGNGTGVLGESAATSGMNGGVYGLAHSTEGTGVVGNAMANSGMAIGVAGQTASPGGFGIYGLNTAAGFAGYFDGNVQVNGTLSKAAGSFTIDHPLDPANKVLNHSFVESPDMLNLYNGNVLLDVNGAAWVELPAWFEALNREFRYQLTPIGAAMPALYIGQEVQNNRFAIMGGAPGGKVSWQLTGIRHDPYAEQHRIPVEAPKPADQQGTYLFPQGYGQPATLGVNYAMSSQRQAAFAEMQQTMAQSVAASNQRNLEELSEEKQP